MLSVNHSGSPKRPSSQPHQYASVWSGDFQDTGAETGVDLRSAGRTSVHTVGKPSHLGVTALAGVAPSRLWKSDYHVQCLQECHTEDATALVAAEGVATEGSEFGLRAEGAGQGPGFALRVVHEAFLFIALTTP